MTTINVTQDERPKKTLPYTLNDPYYIGDCYQPSEVVREWEIDSTTMPYLAHIKSLRSSWKPLRQLADFMEVGTEPVRWRDVKNTPGEREERITRTNVTCLEFSVGKRTSKSRFENSRDLKNYVDGLVRANGGQGAARIFVVEDLSRDVVEILGSAFDVDPLFFREQIDDYTWYNTRDASAMASNLMVGMNHRSWFRVRNARLRYFESKDAFEKSRHETRTFNVSRRHDNDENHWNYKDKPGSIVSMTRTRTAIWVGKMGANDEVMVGIVLVDPTVEGGKPLWYGHVNWLLPPGMEIANTNPIASDATLFQEIIHWTETYPWFESAKRDTPIDTRIIAKPTLFTICAEWLVVCDYVKARLSQIEWELEKPSLFRSQGDHIDTSLKRLHTWRRVIPVFREMRVQRALDELQSRVDRLSSVVTAEISIEDARRGLEENHNLARLTWLATIFIPLSYVSGLFSMAEDISTMRETFGWYFAAALPLTVIAMVVASGVGQSWWKPKSSLAGQNGQ
ncbi:hypothetical protein CC78DRAFT_471907 [Lojkania enalia]|uniref:Uncharacterized protein n=1 Tax=Lojkania enalia TaxID=147567 RepID=A0A9P4K681_9PLEO|nr:hypothetical protein CC78DRAFT_471907 [Didymosphaeria enalia]